MAKHAPTGAGRVSVHRNAPLGGIRAAMSNYDIDVDTLKQEHIYFLDTRIVPLVSGKRARIWLQGSASSTGTDAHNMALSRRRAENVARYLEGRGVQGRQIQIDAVGEGLATLTPAENSDDRAVAILAAPLFDPPPPPAPRPPQRTPTAKSFRLRLVGGIGAGARIIAVDRLYFEIWDPEHKISSIYEYTGGGIGQSVKSVSATMKGPWNDFKTTGPLAVNEFHGAARFTTAGAGSYTLNYLNMMQMPRGTATMPNPLSISTGFTVGIGASTTVGGMALMSTGPFAED